MLFNSYFFLLIFLPTTVIGYYLIGARGHHRIAVSWLVGASLVFYGYWNPAYLWLIIVSMLFNFACGVALGSQETMRPKLLLAFSVACNLIALGYFKYANFFVENANLFADAGWTFDKVVLPLGISFFTFTQIAYLVDAYRKEVRELSFLRYALFVTFFPHLIAGPVLHHSQIMPRFAIDSTYRLNLNNLAAGIGLFIFGLFKKVVMADGVAQYASPVFGAAISSPDILFMEGWGGALAYTFQLYFDFSGYSDMAVGLALMFNVLLPINFNSPYRATNLIEFWRRWHMTLSRFLRDYLYIPLGGGRKGKIRRYLNLLLVMLLGGFWHGAGWTFIVWGGLHGVGLAINHGWRELTHSFTLRLPLLRLFWSITGLLLTFSVVTVGWVVFRADSLEAARRILSGMAGLNGIHLPQVWSPHLGFLKEWVIFSDKDGEVFGRFGDIRGYAWLLSSFLWIWLLPSAWSLFTSLDERSGLPILRAINRRRYYDWRPNLLWAVLSGTMLVISMLHMSRVSEFLYFQF